MFVEKHFNTRFRQTGLSLIELMISIALGLLLLAAATAMTVSSMVMNADTLKSARLNQNLDSVNQIMVNDIRRAGYSANFDPLLASVDYGIEEDLNIVSSSCVLYAYNANGDNVKDPNENSGFKLENSEILMRTTCTGTCSTDCDAGTWVSLTDNSVISVTSLSFNSLNSKCISITDPKNYWMSNKNTPNKFTCNEGSTANLTMYALDGAGAYALDATTTLPQSDEVLIGARQVNVQITAELTNDDSMQKSQRVAINVRNNHVQTKP